jgi:hypothetical protein
MVDHVLLAGLPECQPIHGKRVAEALESIELAAEREGEDVALDLCAVLERVDPVWDEFRVGRKPVSACEIECGRPRVPSVGECAGAMLQGYVLADRVALVAMDAAFALLEVDTRTRERGPPSTVPALCAGNALAATRLRERRVRALSFPDLARADVVPMHRIYCVEPRHAPAARPMRACRRKGVSFRPALTGRVSVGLERARIRARLWHKPLCNPCLGPPWDGPA